MDKEIKTGWFSNGGSNFVSENMRVKNVIKSKLFEFKWNTLIYWAWLCGWHNHYWFNKNKKIKHINKVDDG